MEYHSLSPRNRSQYTTQRIQQLDCVEKPHWRLEENKDDNTHAISLTILSTYTMTSLQTAKYHHGFHKAVLCVEVFKQLLYNLDREALSPLFIFCEDMAKFIDGVSKTQALTTNSSQSEADSIGKVVVPPKRHKTVVAPVPRAPKRFIELPKQERHVLRVAHYLKEFMSKLVSGGSPRAGGKLQSRRVPLIVESHDDDVPPIKLHTIKTKLRNHKFFSELPTVLLADSGGAINTHQAFASYFLCLHEVVRSTSHHSAELAAGAFDLLGEILHAIQANVIEVMGHRKKLRADIRELRIQRQTLRSEVAGMDAEAQAIVAEAVKLSTVLSYIEFESSALVDECNWHDACKDLLLNTIKKLREAVNQPPLWYVTPDGSTKALEFGTSILRAHNAQHIQTLVHLLVLSRSYHHVRMSAHGIVMEAFPERKLAKLNHKDRAKTLRMHLMNQRPIEDGNSQTSVAVAPPATPSTPASASLHQVSEAELVALASIQESLRAVEIFMRDQSFREMTFITSGVQTQISEPSKPATQKSDPTRLSLPNEVAKLPLSWQTSFSLLEDEEPVVPLTKDEMHAIVSAMYGHYENVVSTGTTLSFRDFIVVYFFVHDKTGDQTTQEGYSAQRACARFLVSIRYHVENVVALDWLGCFAAFVGISKNLTLPIPRAMDAFLSARRSLLASAVIRQRVPSANRALWVMAKDINYSSGYTLHDSVKTVLSSFTRSSEAYTNVLLDKSTAVELLLELDDGGRDIQRAQVLHIEAALVILMQAWIREHHHTRSTLERIFSATLSNNDDRKTLAYDEFVVTMGFLDAAFTPARLTTIYVQATDGDSANDVGEASVDRLIDILYESDLFSESKKPWLTLSPMQLVTQRNWEESIDGLNAMWRHNRERILDRLGELKTNQVNLTRVQTCFDRHDKFVRLLEAASDTNEVSTAVDMALYAFHFLQQDITATMTFAKQPKQTKKYFASRRPSF
ncbi:hypothetical protein LEN26_014093 [Aphanomyces euteiches]|nr:hypothetical protein AeMF1_021494 [Aphanomyces euteiches]KAH9108973.1 hypothetical protein LEN26_014093 [Aphanomyces euteiches]KAH9196904.1 hypothetical protein AeNC1_001107 [Aphanomyces euteiches]